MPERKVIHVTPEGGEWDIRYEGTSGPSGHFQDKEDAISQAKDIARGADLGQVIIHKRDGSIETEHTYRRDPRDKPG
jgi:hypothetical protein